MQTDTSSSFDCEILQSFQLIKKVGQGAYGQVWKARDKWGGVWALKKIDNALGKSSDAQKAYRQIKYLERLSHPSIIKMVGYVLPEHSTDAYLQLEYMQADLSTAIRNRVLKDIHKHYIFCQIVSGVHYLHSAQLIHRDLKPSNILVNEGCEARICDFGLVRSLISDSSEHCLTEKIATRWYRPPEILLCSNQYGKEVDVWSLGCILAEIFLERPLFQGSSVISQLEKIFEVLGKPSRQELSFVRSEASKSIVESMTTTKIKSFTEIFPTQDKLLIDLLDKIFKIVPGKRLTIDQILVHPFVNKFKSKIQINKKAQTIKIKHESKKLTTDEYRSLLAKEPQLKMQQDLKTGKTSEPSTYYQSSFTLSLQNNSRQQSFKSLSPLGRFDRESPVRQTENCKLGAAQLNPKVEANSGSKQIFKTIRSSQEEKKQIFITVKSSQEEKKQLLRRKQEIQKKYNIHIGNALLLPFSPIKSPQKLSQDKARYSGYPKTGFLRPLSPIKLFNDVPKLKNSNDKMKDNGQEVKSPPKSLQRPIKQMSKMLKVLQSKSNSKSSKNSPNKIAAEISANESSQAYIGKTIGNKQTNRRENVVPKFILQGRKKLRSDSPPEQLSLAQLRSNLKETSPSSNLRSKLKETSPKDDTSSNLRSKFKETPPKEGTSSNLRSKFKETPPKEDTYNNLRSKLKETSPKEDTSNNLRSKFKETSPKEDTSNNLRSTMNTKSKAAFFRNNANHPMQRTSYNFLRHPNAYLNP